MLEPRISFGRWRRLLCGCLAASFACQAAEGATYYVATNGSDANDGTGLNSPFKTLQKAAARMVAGDRCCVRGGVYRETLRPMASGTREAPIVFAPYRSEAVTISGADMIGRWARYSGKIYRAPMDWDLGMGFNQVFLDGTMMLQARFPKMSTGNSLLNPALADAAVTKDSVISKAFAQPDGFWAGGYVVGGVNVSWSWQWGRIISSSSNGTLSTAQGTAPFPIPKFGDIAWFTGKGRVYLFGKRAALNAPAEWDLEKGTLYLWTPSGDRPKSHLVEAKRRSWTVDFNGKDYVVVEGLRLAAGAVRMSGNHCALRDCTATYMSHFTLVPWSPYDGSGGASDGHQGIVSSGSQNTIKGCTICYTAGSAIVLAGEENLVLRCVIHDVDYSGTYGEPIVLSGGRSRVWFNTIFDAGRDIIYLTGKYNDIRYNDLSRPGLLCKDLGVVYTPGGGQGSRIAYNWVHDNPLAKNGVGPGIYLDNYTRDIQVDHNVVWNCAGDAGIRINAPAVGDRIFNNTLFNCDDVGTHMYSCWPDNKPDPVFWTRYIYAFASENNLYLGANPSSQLVDAAGRDFRRAAHPPAAGSGAAIHGQGDGADRSAPDLGAYERGGVRWTAGVNGVAAGDAECRLDEDSR